MKNVARLSVLCSGNLLVAFLMGAVMPGAAQLAKHFAGAADPAMEAQIIVTIPNVSVIFGSPVAGFLLGRFGRRMPLLLSLALFALAGGAGLVLEGFVPLVISRVLLGLACGGIATTCMTLIGDYYAEPQRTKVIGWAGAMPSIGSVVALFGGGVLVQWGGWHAPYLIYLLAAPMFLVALWAVPEPQVPVAAHGEAGGRMPAGLLWVLPVTVYFALFSVLTSVQMPFLLADNHINVSPEVISTVFVTAGLGASITSANYPRLRKLVPANGVLAIMFSGAAICYFLFATATSLAPIWLGLVIVSSAIGLMVPHFIALTMEMASAEARARSVGLTFAAMSLGQFLIPYVGEPIRIALGMETMLWALGALMVATALAAIAAAGLRRKPVPAPQKI